MRSVWVAYILGEELIEWGVVLLPLPLPLLRGSEVEAWVFIVCSVSCSLPFCFPFGEEFDSGDCGEHCNGHSLAAWVAWEKPDLLTYFTYTAGFFCLGI